MKTELDLKATGGRALSRLSLSPASPSSVLPLWPWLLSSAVPREKVFFVFGPWRGFAVGTTFVLCGVLD